MMKQPFFVLLAIGFLTNTACTDTAKDPFQIDSLVKGDMLALRGEAYDNLFDAAYRGAVDIFSLSASNPATETFDFDTEYLSDQPSSLSEVQVYVSLTDGGDRKLVTKIPASDFMSTTDQKNPSARVSIPVADLLNALNIQWSDLTADGYLFVELDVTLTDGTQVEARDVVNNSLYQSAVFYPAHRLRYLIGQ